MQIVQTLIRRRILPFYGTLGLNGVESAWHCIRILIVRVLESTLEGRSKYEFLSIYGLILYYLRHSLHTIDIVILGV